ncbi:MAG: Excinuclease ABC [Candidatus Gottesmanbacteria bacterium GW2011_GWA1_43_11]|uniref:Excinuclease ABC n=1 Tax=Candidatus Gottesmanbacteria bacterium GW2011_GWA1_43_11 TaxID=1618436 RepID=A0A0G1F8A9_9BACT|nr:MAG: Excinuclease ABC [Candidatus Gottesmanbacteria bacterium GW2011_GWA1_43_11]
MYEVYVLQSLIKNWYYVGLTSDKQRRIKQHNNGQVQSTKAYKPFRLVFSKVFTCRIDARDFEKFLKIRSNKEKLLKKLKLL